MVLAEKLVTAVQRSTTNTRWRDYADMYQLTRRHDIAESELRLAVGAVAEHRGARLFPLAELLDGYASRAQARWQRWRIAQEAQHLPERFDRVLEQVIAFADPLLRGDLPKPENWTWRAERQLWAAADRRLS